MRLVPLHIGITWYLSSLFMWRGSVQYVGGLRHVLPLTFAAGLAVGRGLNPKP
jgi:hypothetical protein